MTYYSEPLAEATVTEKKNEIKQNVKNENQLHVFLIKESRIWS